MSNQPKALRVAEAVEAHCYPHALAVDAARLLREQHAEIERLRAEQLPAPPEECQTEAEKKAFAFGYWSGVAAIRARGEKP